MGKNSTQILSVIFTIIVMVFSTTIWATEDLHQAEDNDNQDDQYQNPFDKISDQNARQLNQWLTLKTSLELEKTRINESYDNSVERTVKEPSSALLELEFEASISDKLSLLINFETEKQGDHDHSKIEESELLYESDPFTFSIGRMTLPFTDYQSYFITGPLLEFSETRSDMLFASYSFDDSLQVYFSILESKADKINASNRVDYAVGIQWESDGGRLLIGGGYLSDLGESEEGFVGEFNNQYAKRVGLLALNLNYRWDHFEASINIAQADEKFDQLDAEIAQPRASNLELAWYPTPGLQLALRVESSSQLEDAAKQQYGIATAWRPYPRLELAVDYLNAKYKSEFIEDDDGNFLQHSDTVAARLSIEF